jgi:hypothetical protein
MLHSEAWQYVGLSGRYAPKDAIVAPSHENQFLVFFHMAEKIKMRQVEEEYWKFTDTTGVGNATNQKPLGIITTPATQQGTLASLPIERKAIIEGWLEELKENVGLQPRTSKESYTIDGAKSPSEVSGTSKDLYLSVQPGLQNETPRESALVPSP